MIARLAAAASCLVLAAPPALAQETVQIPLPTEQDAVAIALGSEGILYGPLGVERTLPGPVTDEELVLVRLAPDGTLAGVTVEQRLLVTGLGDFSFRVPGPARDVEALPGSETSPGLRRGSMLWQGFSDGQKRLAARAELFPEQEAQRMPIRAALEVTVDGRPLAVGARATGMLRVVLRLENVTAIPIQVADAEADARAIEPVLATALDALARGERPKPGAGGIPEAVPARAPVTLRSRAFISTFDIEGRIVLPAGSEPTLTGDARAEGNVVTFGGQLRERPLEVTIEARVTDATLPELALTARPAPPRPDALARKGPPLTRLMDLMWEVARLRQFDGYLGNPDPTGPSTTEYRFTLASPAPVRAEPVVRLRTFGAMGLAMSALAALLILAVAVLAWSLS